MGGVLNGCVKMATYCHDVCLSIRHGDDYGVYMNDFIIRDSQHQETSSIFVAIQDKNLKEVKRHLKPQEDNALMTLIRGEETPLHLACRLGYHNIADCLLDNGCHSSMVTKIGTPVHSLVNAIKCGYITDVKGLQLVLRLVDQGCDINAQDKQGRTALYHAVFNRLDDFSKGMLLLNADPDIPELDNNFTSLHMAVIEMSHFCVSNIVDRAGTNLNAMDHANRTPLILALINIKNFIEHDRYIQRDHSLSHFTDTQWPGAVKAMYDKMAVAELLITAGADLYISDSYDRSPLIIVQKFLMSEVAKYQVVMNYGLAPPTYDTLVVPTHHVPIFAPLARLLVMFGPQLRPVHAVDTYWMSEFDNLPKTEPERQEPRQLRNICRLAIRRYMASVGKLHYVCQLPLPDHLIKYINIDFI